MKEENNFEYVFIKSVLILYIVFICLIGFCVGMVSGIHYGSMKQRKFMCQNYYKIKEDQSYCYKDGIKKNGN